MTYCGLLERGQGFVRGPPVPPSAASGRAEGEITRELRGTNGFGFDPVMFIPELNMTFAEMTDEEKNQRSHRGQAARLMRELMLQRWLK